MIVGIVDLTLFTHWVNRSVSLLIGRRTCPN